MILEIFKVHESGPNTEPCGTSDALLTALDNLPLTVTRFDLPRKVLRYQLDRAYRQVEIQNLISHKIQRSLAKPQKPKSN